MCFVSNFLLANFIVNLFEKKFFVFVINVTDKLQTEAMALHEEKIRAEVGIYFCCLSSSILCSSKNLTAHTNTHRKKTLV